MHYGKYLHKMNVKFCDKKAQFLKHIFHVLFPYKDIETESNVHKLLRRSIVSDGNNNPDWHKNSCTVTSPIPGNWWVVDLQMVYSITKVSITSRIACK